MKPSQLQVSVGKDREELINSIADRVSQRIQQTVEDAIAKSLTAIPNPELPVAMNEESRRGISLPAAERKKAADLRTELLLGKLPVDAGLLIDVKTVAELLNISTRTFHRLCDMKAAPAPVRIGSLVRW